MWSEAIVHLSPILRDGSTGPFPQGTANTIFDHCPVPTGLHQKREEVSDGRQPPSRRFEWRRQPSTCGTITSRHGRASRSGYGMRQPRIVTEGTRPVQPALGDPASAGGLV